MYRFFSLAILLNWLAVLAMIGVMGFSLDSQTSGLIAAFIEFLSANALLNFEASMAEAIGMTGAFSIMAAGLWSIMAVLFSDSSQQHNRDQEFVVTISMAYCLTLFAGLIILAIGSGDQQMGALASVASMSTILAGIALRMSSAMEQSSKLNESETSSSFSLARAQSMASQSASLASAGARATRFIPTSLDYNQN